MFRAMRNRSDILASTRAALAWWAQFNRYGLPTWPKQSAMLNLFSGRGTRHDGEMPAEVEAIESAVNSLYKTDPQARAMILLHYLAVGSCRQKIKRLSVSAREYYARLEHAEYAIKIAMNY